MGTSFGAGLVRHRRASMANYVITRALLKRIEADSTRAAQPVRSRMPRFIGSMKGLSISRRDVRVRLARADIAQIAYAACGIAAPRGGTVERRERSTCSRGKMHKMTCAPGRCARFFQDV